MWFLMYFNAFYSWNCLKNALIIPIIFEQIVANIKLLALYTNKLIIDHNTIDTIADPKLNVAYVKLPKKVQIITIKYNSNILMEIYNKLKFKKYYWL